MTIQVKPIFVHQNAKLNTEIITQNSDTVTISKCKYYLTNFNLIYKNGTVFSESNSNHLIDLSDSSTFNLIFNNIPKGKIIKVNFSIGVDSVKSISGAMEGDLDPTLGMYWAWNSGYINAKLEGTHSQIKTPNSKFEYHIGGYSGKDKTIQLIELKTKLKIKKKPITVKLESDLSVWFTTVLKSKKYHILIPGKEAVKMSNSYKNMFKLL